MKRVLIFTLACMLIVPGFANFKEYRKAAEQGDANAQYNLGVCYEKGEGVKKDLSQAVQWYRKAAEQGMPGAQSKLKELEK